MSEQETITKQVKGIEAPLFEKLVESAAKNDRTVSAEIRHRLRRSFVRVG